MQTAVWIKPKDGHDRNRTAARYARSEKTGRKGRRELDPDVMDAADIEEFCSIVEKWEWYKFPSRFPELSQQINQHPTTGKSLPPGVFPVITDMAMLAKIAVSVSPDLSMEIFEVANDLSKLSPAEKKTRTDNVFQPVEVSQEGAE